MTERSTEETLADIAADELHYALDERGFAVEHVGFDGGDVVAAFRSGHDGPNSLAYLLEDMGAPFTLARSRGLKTVTMTHRVATELADELNR